MSVLRILTTRFRTPALIAGATAALAGCTGTSELIHVTEQTAAYSNLVAQAANTYQDQRMVATAVRFRAATPDTVTFAFNSAEIDPEARRVLDLQAMWLAANPAVRMRIVGHADAVGGEGYNQRIGLRRARAVTRYLESKGVESSRLDAVESRGEEELLVPTEDRERRNRRSVTHVAGFERGFTGQTLDGRRAVISYYEYTADRTEGAVAEATN